jgi:hypothetical protein
MGARLRGATLVAAKPKQTACTGCRTEGDQAVIASAIIGRPSRRRRRSDPAELPRRGARDKYRGRIGGPRPAYRPPRASSSTRRPQLQTRRAGSRRDPNAGRAPSQWRRDSRRAADGSGCRALCRSPVYGVTTGRTKRLTSFNPASRPPNPRSIAKTLSDREVAESDVDRFGTRDRSQVE